MAVSLVVVVTIVLAAMALFRARGRFAGTTLLPPIYWAIAVCFVGGGLEVASALGAVHAGEAGRRTWEYLAAVATLAPPIAVLGAKRPQDKAWQVIVATLLVVLCLPAVQTWAFHDGKLQVHFILRWFLIVPVAVMGLVYMLPTRHVLKALLAGIGLAGVWWPSFATDSRMWSDGLTAFQAGAFCLALAALWWSLAPRRRDVPPSWDRVWCEFRDAFGAVWGLRVMQRFNATAEQCGWNVTLTWYGLHSLDDRPVTEQPAETRDAIEQSFRTLLRRFVDEAWMAECRSPA